MLVVALFLPNPASCSLSLSLSLFCLKNKRKLLNNEKSVYNLPLSIQSVKTVAATATAAEGEADGFCFYLEIQRIIIKIL